MNIGLQPYRKWNLYELPHNKTGLKIFVVVAVIQKEGLASTSPVKPPFAMTPNIELHSICIVFNLKTWGMTTSTLRPVLHDAPHIYKHDLYHSQMLSRLCQLLVIGKLTTKFSHFELSMMISLLQPDPFGRAPARSRRWVAFLNKHIEQFFFYRKTYQCAVLSWHIYYIYTKGEYYSVFYYNP